MWIEMVGRVGRERKTEKGEEEWMQARERKQLCGSQIGAELGAVDHDAELSTKIYGAKLGAKIYGVELGNTSAPRE